ncbi:hypothetical protein [Paraflavitalea sp. sgz302552]|uniref:hypothetical protein n=2 Tax=unclassified Paraflavitalea TaxID=2798305 RepID=UPI003D324B5E
MRKNHEVMLSKKEADFVEYWEKNRLLEKKWTRQWIIGLPVGLIFSIPIILILLSGKFWYNRAEAMANAKLNPSTLLISIGLIVCFVAIFYKKHQWDMKEQLYLELKAKQKRQQGNQDAASQG